MKRKIYDKLKAWKARENGKTALLVEGARRVGKSWIVTEFAKQEYKAHLIIDFSEAGNEIKDLFNFYLHNLDEFFKKLQQAFDTTLPIRDSIIVFDEVQQFPKAREAIKKLVADGRYDYIETGSLMSIRENTEDILIPSEEDSLKMYPLDFEEFLWANGNTMLMDAIRDSFASKSPMGSALHRKAIDYFREYMVVGGMPQAVNTYIETQDLGKTDIVKRRILKLYRDDIVKHARRFALSTRRIFDDIPSQLKRHDKKFRPSSIGKNVRMRNCEDALFWLEDAMIINPCFNSTEPNVGLKINMERSTLKCYMGDTGLLISHAFDENELAAEKIHHRLLFGSLELNEGMLVENIVAQMLVASGKKLYYFTKADPRTHSESMEIDFLVSSTAPGRRKNIYPIEVKSSKKYTTTSLDKYCGKYKSYCGAPYILHSKDIEIKDGITRLPLYMASLI